MASSSVKPAATTRMREYAPYGFVARDVEWPAGVESAIVDSVTPGWQPGRSLRVVVETSPAFAGGYVVLRGWLTNDSDRAVDTYVVSAPHTQGPLLIELTGPGVRLLPFDPASIDGPPRPEVYPAPEKLSVPAHTRVPFRRDIVLSRYEHPAGAHATVSWTFQFWTQPAAGTFDIVLP